MAFAALTIAACAGKDAPAAASNSSASAPSSATASEVATQVAAASGSLSTYEITTDNVTKVTQVMRTIDKLEKTDPALKAAWDQQNENSNPKTIDDAVARVQSAPRAPEILKEAGISAHDYVYTTFALMYASVAYQLKKSGRPVTAPQLVGQINPANVDFVATHQKEIAAMDSIGNSGDEN